MSVAFATRRLWLRRARIPLLILTKVLYAPIAVIRFPFDLYRAAWKSDGLWGVIGTTAFIVIISLFLGGISWNFWYHSKGAKFPPPAEIIEFRKADSCHDHTLPRRAAEWKRPVTYKDLWQLEEDCQKFWKEEKAKAEQAKALAAQLGAVK